MQAAYNWNRLKMSVRKDERRNLDDSSINRLNLRKNFKKGVSYLKIILTLNWGLQEIFWWLHPLYFQVTKVNSLEFAKDPEEKED